MSHSDHYKKSSVQQLQEAWDLVNSIGGTHDGSPEEVELSNKINTLLGNIESLEDFVVSM
jgi:hypothetical protein